ncbi:MAG: hypothetical protein LJE68_16760, partial [Rhodobacter sp.]|nr:hypothetical protein [Rhodobacter sp.]
MADDIQPIETETGAFPFPLKDGPVESHYLTWLRNHSNYMVQGGIADYLRIVAVLVRGIILNFLIMLPYFLIFAAALSLVHLFLSQPQSVTLQFSEDAQPAETFTPIEELKIVVRSNLGEADELTVDFDTTDDNFHASMKTLAARLEVTPGQFDTLWWFFDASRDVNGREVIDRDGEVIGLIKAIDKQNGNAVFFSRDEIRTGFIEEELISRPPLFFSMTVLGIATLLIILYPVAVRMGRVRNFRRALATGQLSSVLRRDRYERMFGTLLLLVLVVAALESFPRLSVFFHSLRQGDVSIAIPTLASMFGGLVVANQALPMLGERVKKVAMVFVGLLGLMIPLVLILFVVEFLVYSDMKGLIAQDAEIYVSAALVVLPIIFAILLFATWVMGLREFSWLGHLKLIFLFASMIVLGVAAVLLADYIHGLFPDNPRYLFIYFVVAAAVEIAVYCWLAVDVNQTSINGLYRDRLASAYLIGVDTGGDIAIEKDLHLQEICNYSAGSTAPYHLINTALNLQATKDINIRDRHSDFFMFSKRFIGGRRTGYCRSENMEAVFPQMDLGTAMAVSAAAASPNMGRGTNRLMVAFLTLLNIRLGFWLPNPDRLEKYLHKALKTQNGDPARHTIDFFDDVFPTELAEVAQRRAQLAPGAPRPIADSTLPTVEHGLVGIGFSGGGIRSATLNLGMAQALHRAGVFDHIDYMSTVSGGGYLGSSISTLMRFKTSPYAMVAGT